MYKYSMLYIAGKIMFINYRQAHRQKPSVQIISVVSFVECRRVEIKMLSLCANLVRITSMSNNWSFFLLATGFPWSPGFWRNPGH